MGTNIKRDDVIMEQDQVTEILVKLGKMETLQEQNIKSNDKIHENQEEINKALTKAISGLTQEHSKMKGVLNAFKYLFPSGLVITIIIAVLN